ncbi:universal stress protein [Natrinema zhouii]|uniref:Universal stress protein n=1 Tax=Natrinema zhouii TaxID=1710539 RepID=A0A7D6CQ06_9EURY|nr:universal stress protein [Natrinema zhouii]QLK27117.1 universal stress protein [Natrinema zhouii]
MTDEELATDLGPLAMLTIGVGTAIVAALWHLFDTRDTTEEQDALTEFIRNQTDEMPKPAVTAATSVKPDGGRYRVMVPVANPDHETDLITLASTIAKQRGGTVVAIHIVQVPDQTPLEKGADHVAEFDAESKQLLEQARRDAEPFGVDVETRTILSHRSFDEVFDAAQTTDADLVVMGWGPRAHGRAEQRRNELVGELPCDFLVYKNRGFDASRILVPTAGGPDSELGATVAKLLADEYDSDVSLLYIRDDDESTADAEAFLEDWATDHELADATLLIEAGDPGTAIQRAARDRTLVIVGATERGLLTRLLRNSLIDDVAETVDCSVVLAQRRHARSLRERLFGWRA